MIVVPAIDILGGRCVRLYQGDYSRSTVYDFDPAEVAREFEAAGAKRIHLVDLDAARGGENNRAIVRRVRAAVSCIIELGGGVRREEDIRELVDIGVDRIVVGTMIVREPDAVAAWSERYGRLVAGIDARDGRVRVSGWEDDTSVSDEEAAEWAGTHGLRSIIYTDISRDGALTGPSFERTARIAEVSGLPVILSGGISSLDDIDAAAKTKGVVAAITGRALYEGKIDLRLAIERYQDAQSAGQW